MKTIKELRVRYWVYIDGVKFFGLGKVELLKHIQESGSIANAAKAMGMSYKKAWAMVDDMNTKGQNPYVIAKKGGQRGGGTELTETGLKLIAAYDQLNNKLLATLNEGAEILEFI